jgi:hypothetical protein
MRTREASVAQGVAFLVLLSLIAAPGCKRARCGPAPDNSVVACVGDEPVGRGEAREFLREADYAPGSATLSDPAVAAVEQAVRLRLLAQEARRRGLAPPKGAPASPAVLAQVLLADELARRGFERDRVSPEEARRFYDEHPDAFGQVDGVHMQAIVVADAGKAEQAYREAQGADEARFAQLAERLSEDATSRASKGEIPPVHASKGADRALLRLGLSLRRKGAIGGPVKADDGRFYVVRIQEVELTRVLPWEEQAQAKARNIIVFEHKEALSRELVASLSKTTPVRRFSGAFAALRAPAPGTSR